MSDCRMPENFSVLARPHIESLLEPGEMLRGVAAAVHQKTFSGTLYAIGVTDRRVLLQPVGRKGEPKDQPRILTAETVSRPSSTAPAAAGGPRPK